MGFGIEDLLGVALRWIITPYQEQLGVGIAMDWIIFGVS